MTTVEHSRLLTVRQVADGLGVSTVTIRRRIRSGELPAIRLSSGEHGAVRIDERDLEAWLYAEPKECP